jgi:hypothetical protein
MARMSREFSLVLLGAGLLSAGYFLWPEEDPIKLANDEAAKGGGGGTGGRGYRSGYIVIFHSTTTGPSRAFASSSSSMSGTSRGGFGRSGVSFSGG